MAESVQQTNTDRGIGQPSATIAADSGYPGTTQPETGNGAGGPGAAPADSTVLDNAKGTLGDLFGGQKRQPNNTSGPTGPVTEGAAGTKVGFLDKMKEKLGKGHRGTGAGNPSETSPYGTGAGTDSYGTVTSPTGVESDVGDRSEASPYGVGAGTPSDGSRTDSYGAGAGPTEAGYDARNESSPYGRGAGLKDPNTGPANSGVADGAPAGTGEGVIGKAEQQRTGHEEGYGAGTGAVTSGMNPNTQGLPDAWPRPTSPQGATNAHGGATLTDAQGNVQEGPRIDTVKKEGFMTKMMDKLHLHHSPKGQATGGSAA